MNNYKLTITKLDFGERSKKLQYRNMIIKYHFETHETDTNIIKRMNTNIINFDFEEYYQKHKYLPLIFQYHDFIKFICVKELGTNHLDTYSYKVTYIIDPSRQKREELLGGSRRFGLT